MSSSSRAVTARQLETELKATLLKLKTAEEDKERLILEREENEHLFVSLLNNNTQLKRELSESKIYSDSLNEQLNHLELELGSFRQSTEMYEDILMRNTTLEKRLGEAQRQIDSYEQAVPPIQSLEINNQYNLVVVASAPLSSNSPAIAFANKSSLCSNCNNNKCNQRISHKKFKKLKKLNKIIKKNNLQLRINTNKSRLLKSGFKMFNDVSSQLALTESKLAESQELYCADIARLKSYITELEERCSNLMKTIDSSLQAVTEHVIDMESLIEENRYIGEKLHSASNLCTCGAFNQPEISDSLPTLSPCEGDLHKYTRPGCADADDSHNTLIFSDSVGRNMGYLFNQHLENVTNYCLPNASYTHIIESIRATTFNRNSTIVLLIGNCNNLCKKDIICGLDSLNKLNVYKVIICAFPYLSCQPPSKNKNIHYFNNLTYCDMLS
nr:uncharacterized protein LOC128678045 isoform X1 [Plodia interpunctella]XP_053615265.1 uncharacterized protein LOC128678045 isoform X1 [Plodia interpunctella]XP_053615267.1 uncharacterized protein LOC128678045 isoform X1 [Plodia interpunctella]